MSIQLDLFTGKKWKEKAIQRVYRSTSPEWIAKMEGAVRSLIARQKEFTTDDVWVRLGAQPREPRALGAIILAFYKSGAIRRTGSWKQSKRPECHCRPLAVWEPVTEINN